MADGTPSPVASHAVLASMREHGVSVTLDSHAVWQCYLSGSNAGLKRAIDILLSNGLPVDERTVRALYKRHFCRSREAYALRDAAQRARAALSGLRLAMAHDAQGEDLALLDLDMKDIVSRSEALAAHLAESEQRVAELERSLDEARQAASTDALTGVANRRSFDAKLRAVAGDAMNNGAELTVLMIDIDHFKQVNDRWGHVAGDEVLRLTASTLVRTIRGGDYVARYGGEEFVVILPGTNPLGALAVAEKLRHAVEQQVVPVLQPGTGDLRVTISAGVACYDHGERLADWLQRADAALYQAKNSGRNRVHFGDLLATGESNVVAMPLRA